MRSILLGLIILISSCSQNADDRASIDQSTGYWRSSKIVFSSEKGHLHILNADNTKIILRAVNSEFLARIENLTNKKLTLDITINNLKQTSPLEIDNALESETLESTNTLKRAYKLTIGPNQTSAISSKWNAPNDFAFIAMGDIQNGIENFDDVIEKINTLKDEVDFLLFLGDATMRSGKDEFEKVLKAYDKIEIPIYSTPGNHDINSTGLFQRYFGKGNYSFEHKGVRFTSLDSGDWGLGKTSWKWLRSWLENGRDQPHIVYSHIPPKDINGIRGGHWRSRREAHAFIGHAARYKVDRMFFGHLHTLDQYQLAGIPIVVSGGAGAFEEMLDGIKRHFVKVLAKPNEAQFYLSTILID